MPPSFSQQERRNLFLPVILALTVMASATFLLLRYTPRSIADLTLIRTATWQAHTIFKSDTILVGKDTAQNDLYVLATLRIDDRLKLPLFLKDFTATLTTATGETLMTSALEKPELAPLYMTYPALKSLSTPSLDRDTAVAPGQSATGMVLFHFPITQDTWDHRQAATLTIDLYHQPPQTITIGQLIPKP